MSKRNDYVVDIRILDFIEVQNFLKGEERVEKVLAKEHMRLEKLRINERR